MTSRSKLGLLLLGALALGCLAFVVLQDDTIDGPANDLTADGGPADGAGPGVGMHAGATPGSTNGRAPSQPGGTPGGPDTLIGARTPAGIDLSQPETRAAELERLLGAVPVDDWRAVARIVALMPADEPIPDALRPVLLNELRSGKRLQVMHVFAHLRDASFVEDLFEVLESNTANQGHQRIALEALWKMPGGDDNAIARRLESSLSGDTQKDGNLLRAIGKRGGQEAARAMVEYLQRVKNPSDLQMHILQSLDVSADEAAAQIVAEALEQEASAKVQRALITMVMRPGASAMTEPLIGIDRDGVDKSVRARALQALGRIGDEKAVAYLLQRSAEPGAFGEQALTAVGKLDSASDEVGALLAKALGDADSNPRPTQAKASLLQALGNARHEPSLPTVARSLDDRDPTVQKAAIRAMGRMGSKAEGYIPRLVTVYEGGDAARRQQVAIALAEIGGEQAILQMRRLLEVKDLDPSVKRTLQMGLRTAETRLPKTKN